jgi:ABC-type glutathione transport system ATPase component
MRAPQKQTILEQRPEGMEEPLIRVIDLHKYYEMGDARVHALKGISLDIRRRVCCHHGRVRIG